MSWKCQQGSTKEREEKPHIEHWSWSLTISPVISSTNMKPFVFVSLSSSPKLFEFRFKGFDSKLMEVIHSSL